MFNDIPLQGYDHQLRNRLLKRSIDNSGECPSLEVDITLTT